MKTVIIKAAVKFAFTHFTLETLILIIAYILFPNLYPGDSFLVIWIYVLNILIGIILFPISILGIRLLIDNNKVIYILLCFSAILIITNILPLFEGHIIYTLELIKLAFRNVELRTTGIFELFDLVISFCVTCFIFRKSDLLYPSKMLDE
jgi:hypothetical protein